MGAAPWDRLPAEETLFVLVTGANGGIGLATCERIIDEFLETRSLTSHLVIIPTTRSASKCRETVAYLRQHVDEYAHSSEGLQLRSPGPYDPQDTISRVHVLSLSVDLCDLRSVQGLARELLSESVSNPEGLEGEYLTDVRVPRLDAVVFNAGIGGWSGFNLLAGLWQMLTQGIPIATTWPNFKTSAPTKLLNDVPANNYPAQPPLEEVFCAGVFGHYMLAHNLMPLLHRSTASERPGRVVWTSSVEAVDSAFRTDDIQALRNPLRYESVKRLTDLLSLTSTSPAVQPFKRSWLEIEDEKTAAERPVAPKVYLTHPGIVVSSLMPVPWFLMWAYRLAVVIARYLGSPWHPIEAYPGAKANTWMVLQSQEALDSMDAERTKWGSSTDASLWDEVKMTEVDGWGWEGKPSDAESVRADTAVGVLHRSVGRRWDRDTTEEDIARFEEQGAECWRQMEAMRVQWTNILSEKEELEKQLNGPSQDR